MTAETHVEPFIHLADVTHDSALVAWGAFWSQRRRRRAVDGRALELGASGPNGDVVAPPWVVRRR